MRRSFRLRSKSESVTWDKVWENELKKQQDPRNIFGQRLFVEGYDVIRQYISAGCKSILDIGAGTGRYGLTFARKFPKAEVTITDIVDSSIKFIRKLQNDLRLNNVKVEKADMFRLSYTDNYFDVVFCDAVIQHVNDPKDAIVEMMRVLKPGGRLIVSAVNTWNIPHSLYKIILKILQRPYPYGYEKSYTRKELKNSVEDSGLEVIALDGFYFAYGIFRLKSIFKPFKLLGRICNRLVKIINPHTGRFIDKYLGFEIFAVGVKLDKD